MPKRAIAMIMSAMSNNTFGKLLCVTSFDETHGQAGDGRMSGEYWLRLTSAQRTTELGQGATDGSGYNYDVR